MKKIKETYITSTGTGAVLPGESIEMIYVTEENGYYISLWSQTHGSYVLAEVTIQAAIDKIKGLISVGIIRKENEMKIDFTKHAYRFIVAPELSKKFQKRFFKAGGKWFSGDMRVLYTNLPFLFVENLKLSFSSDALEYTHYMNDHIEVTYGAIMKALKKKIKKNRKEKKNENR